MCDFHLTLRNNLASSFPGATLSVFAASCLVLAGVGCGIVGLCSRQRHRRVVHVNTLARLRAADAVNRMLRKHINPRLAPVVVGVGSNQAAEPNRDRYTLPTTPATSFLSRYLSGPCGGRQSWSGSLRVQPKVSSCTLTGGGRGASFRPPSPGPTRQTQTQVRRRRRVLLRRRRPPAPVGPPPGLGRRHRRHTDTHEISVPGQLDLL